VELLGQHLPKKEQRAGERAAGRQQAAEQDQGRHGLRILLLDARRGRSSPRAPRRQRAAPPRARAILCTLLHVDRYVIVQGVLWWPWKAAQAAPTTGVSKDP